MLSKQHNELARKLRIDPATFEAVFEKDDWIIRPQTVALAAAVPGSSVEELEFVAKPESLIHAEWIALQFGREINVREALVNWFLLSTDQEIAIRETMVKIESLHRWDKKLSRWCCLAIAEKLLAIIPPGICEPTKALAVYRAYIAGSATSGDVIRATRDLERSYAPGNPWSSAVAQIQVIGETSPGGDRDDRFIPDGVLRILRWSKREEGEDQGEEAVWVAKEKTGWMLHETAAVAIKYFPLTAEDWARKNAPEMKRSPSGATGHPPSPPWRISRHV